MSRMSESEGRRDTVELPRWSLTRLCSGDGVAALIAALMLIAVFSISTTLVFAALGYWLAAIAAGALSAVSCPLLGDVMAFDLGRRHRETRLRRVRGRAAAKLDRAEGWRPRQDVPHPNGRTDTHDRWLIEVDLADSREDTRRYAVRLRRWTYEDSVWHSREASHTRLFDVDDIRGVGDYRGTLQSVTEELQRRSLQQTQVAAEAAHRDGLHRQLAHAMSD
jgi:hypothetical protein